MDGELTRVLPNGSFHVQQTVGSKQVLTVDGVLLSCDHVGRVWPTQGEALVTAPRGLPSVLYTRCTDTLLGGAALMCIVAILSVVLASCALDRSQMAHGFSETLPLNQMTAAGLPNAMSSPKPLNSDVLRHTKNLCAVQGNGNPDFNKCQRYVRSQLESLVLKDTDRELMYRHMISAAIRAGRHALVCDLVLHMVATETFMESTAAR